MNIQDILARDVEMGAKAKEFVNSELGNHIITRSLEECEELREKLENISTPHTLEGDHLLRQEIFARTAALKWLMDTINQGDVSFKNLDSPEE